MIKGENVNMIKVNDNKKLVIDVDGVRYARIPIRTHVITPQETWEEVLDSYLGDNLEDGDMVFIAESVVSVMQGRAIKLCDIKPRKLARFLSSHVGHNPGGVGLTCPEMMEMAFQEVGTPRMLCAAVASVVGKLLGKKGWFYIVAGADVRDIDGPDEYTLPPYDEYVVLAPKDPNVVARDMTAHLGHQVMIVDINDLGQNILGNSSLSTPCELIASILRDNPLGQSSEQTPIGIIRKMGYNDAVLSVSNVGYDQYKEIS